MYSRKKPKSVRIGFGDPEFDAEGRYVAAAVPPGPALTWASASGYARSYWPGQDRPSDARIEGGGEGVTLDAGATSSSKALLPAPLSRGGSPTLGTDRQLPRRDATRAHADGAIIAPGGRSTSSAPSANGVSPRRPSLSRSAPVDRSPDVARAVGTSHCTEACAPFAAVASKRAGSTRSTPSGALGDAITKAFGSFDAFKTEFGKAAAGRFGSGWAWLVRKADGTLEAIGEGDARIRESMIYMEAPRADARTRWRGSAAAQFALDAADEDAQHPRRQCRVIAQCRAQALG